jgi:two-component system nitrate/nitrite response regulator NarL
MINLNYKPLTISHNVVALNAGKFWLESLESFFQNTHFVLHPRSDLPLRELSIDALGLGPPSIVLYRDTGGAGHCVEWVKTMRAHGTKAKLVVIVGHLSPEVLVSTMQAGANGFLTEDISGQTLVQSLELVMGGERVLPGALGDFIAREGIPPLLSEAVSDSGLSSRESDVLKRLARGGSNKVIATALSVSESTIKGNVKAILKKIAAQNRTQAAVWALNEGMLDPVLPTMDIPLTGRRLAVHAPASRLR